MLAAHSILVGRKRRGEAQSSAFQLLAAIRRRSCFTALSDCPLLTVSVHAHCKAGTSSAHNTTNSHAVKQKDGSCSSALECHDRIINPMLKPRIEGELYIICFWLLLAASHNFLSKSRLRHDSRILLLYAACQLVPPKHISKDWGAQVQVFLGCCV